MLRRLADARARGDEGAVAILTAIVVVFVLIPLSAVAIGSYTRSGVGAEVHRGGDSGALAGASKLGLTNLGSLSSVLPLPTLTVNNDDLLALPGLTSSLQDACTNALKAYGVATLPTTGTAGPGSWTTTVSDPRSTTKSNPNSPLGRAFGEITRCKASYTPDPALASCLSAAQGVADPLLGPVNQVLNSSLSNLQSVLSSVLTIRSGLTVNLSVLGINIGSTINATTDNLLSTLVSQLQSAISQLTRLNTVLSSLLPALLRNGIVVDLDYDVQGPLDTLLHPGGPTKATTRSAARRVFQPLLPTSLALPAGVTVVGNVGGSTNVAIGGLALTSGLQLNATEQLTVNALELIIQTLRQTVSGTATLQDGLIAALDGRNSILNRLYAPLVSSLTSLQGLPVVGPLLGSLSILPSRTPTLNLGTVLPACRPAVDDLLDDLSDALTVNRDPNRQDLLGCLTERVLGVTGLPSGLGSLPVVSRTPVVDAQACVNRIFRSQVGPNPTYAQVPR